ncbi:E3 ubiquitin-protein ligase RING1-like [Pyrus ussuriensis x Pyrus communis]|uniref:RING-type E3 ubiquitin transferase n=1 Tax=Pyrus ussuriensis x Pyrus communis TaxID=2448454 RepID=A0A5N5G8W7_9ROSA|nr:E3 ubiquitin-protein ligase RING1-like [Pyrus ussuriensis x Pyrus communis]
MSDGDEEAPFDPMVGMPRSSSSHHLDDLLEIPLHLRRLQMEVARRHIRRYLEARDDNLIHANINYFNHNIGNRFRQPSSAAVAASKASIDAMPRVTVTEVGADCAICMGDLEIGGEAREMPCKHRFHSPCIEAWLCRRASCPLCRFSVPKEEHH